MQTFEPFDWLSSSDPPETWAFERHAAAGGARAIAGVDEVGRGPLAGPIVAGAVMLGTPVDGVDDSKRLTESTRERLFALLTDGTHAVGIAVVDHARIDEVGIQTANYQVMREALLALRPAPEFALVDGFAIPQCPMPQVRIVKGDRRSCSIAAASIVAKVTRDRMMKHYDTVYPGYGFGRNKGYGTREHLEALERLGPTPIHRRSFAPLSRRTETVDVFGNGEGST